MSYREHELEQSYDKLEDQYWELVEWLQEHAPFALECFKNRKKSYENL